MQHFPQELKDHLKRLRITPVYVMSLTYPTQPDGTLLPVEHYQTGIGDLAVGGVVYRGIGHVAQISEINQETGLRQTGMDITFSYLDDDGFARVAEKVESVDYQGGSFDIAIAFVSDETGLAVGEPAHQYAGQIGDAKVSVVDGPTIVLNIYPPTIQWHGRDGGLISHRQHLQRTGTDMFYQFYGDQPVKEWAGYRRRGFVDRDRGPARK